MSRIVGIWKNERLKAWKTCLFQRFSFSWTFMLSWVEHEKITSEPGLSYNAILCVCWQRRFWRYSLDAHVHMGRQCYIHQNILLYDSYKRPPLTRWNWLSLVVTDLDVYRWKARFSPGQVDIRICQCVRKIKTDWTRFSTGQVNITLVSLLTDR